MPLVLFAFSVSLAWSMRLDCTYNNSLSSYTCVAKVSFTDGDEHKVNEVSQNHMGGKSNYHVMALQIDHQGLRYMPRGVENYFPNLKILRIFYTQISEISSDDLKLPELTTLTVAHGPLQSLDGDLFKNNPKLTVINFSVNSLKHVGPNVLTSMYNFNSVYLENNICINRKIVNNKAAVAGLINDLRVNCPQMLTLTSSTTTASPPINYEDLVEKNLAEKTCKLVATCPPRTVPQILGISQEETKQLVEITVTEKMNAAMTKISKMETDIQNLVVSCSNKY